MPKDMLVMSCGYMHIQYHTLIHLFVFLYRPVMSYSKLLHLFCLLQYSLLSKYMFSTDADKLPDLQKTASTICPSRSTTCGTLASRPSSERPTTCCGFCDCGPNCVEYGSCCLTEYFTLRHARDSTESSR